MLRPGRVGPSLIGGRSGQPFGETDEQLTQDITFDEAESQLPRITYHDPDALRSEGSSCLSIYGIVTLTPIAREV